LTSAARILTPEGGEAYHRAVRSRRKTERRRIVFCLAAVVLQFLFSAAAALPGIVFCHRPGGRIAAEFSGPSGACLCDECEHCLEHLAAAASGVFPNGPVIDACHCVHEPFLSQAARAVLKRDEGRTLPGPAAIRIHAPAVFPLSTRLRSFASSLDPRPDAVVPPPGTQALRC